LIGSTLTDDTAPEGVSDLCKDFGIVAQLGEKVVIREESFPQALKREHIFDGLRHEWNSCPSRKSARIRAFPQVVKPLRIFSLRVSNRCRSRISADHELVTSSSCQSIPALIF
jgi:hypothetical protein